MSKTLLPTDLAQQLQKINDDILTLQNAQRAMNLQPVLSLPANPYNGQVILFKGTVDSTVKPGVLWMLRYNQASPYAYKWDFIGGAASLTSSGAYTGVTATTYATGKVVTEHSITLPLAGDYQALLTARGYSSSNTAGGGFQFAIGTGTTQIGGQIDEYQGSAGSGVTLFAAGNAKQVPFTRTTANTPLDARLYASSGTVQIDTSEVSILPVRLG